MKLLQSKLVAFFLLVFLSFILVSLGKAVYRKYQINQEIEKIKTDIARLEGENEKLLDMVEYLKTNEFLEKEAREKLNMSKDGEKIIAIPFFEEKKKEPEKLKNISQEKTTEPKKNMANYQLWWNYFFGEEKVMGKKSES